jgi:hypothetical protein
MHDVHGNRRPPTTGPRRRARRRTVAQPIRLADLHSRYQPETLALAAAYLHAFGTGDTATADRLLANCEPTELIAGLTVLACVLADDIGSLDGAGTTTVLERAWRRCAAHHRAAIGLA